MQVVAVHVSAEKHFYAISAEPTSVSCTGTEESVINYVVQRTTKPLSDWYTKTLFSTLH